MTKRDLETFERLEAVMRELKTQERDHSDSLEKKVNSLSNQIQPISLEKDVLKSVQVSIDKAILTTLTDYNSPLKKIILEVVAQNSNELKSIILESFEKVIRTEDFKQSIINGFSHKVARTIISNNDGLFEKVSNELKQDASFKAKMTLAVSNVVNECLNERKDRG